MHDTFGLGQCDYNDTSRGKVSWNGGRLKMESENRGRRTLGMGMGGRRSTDGKNGAIFRGVGDVVRGRGQGDLSRQCVGPKKESLRSGHAPDGP